MLRVPASIMHTYEQHDAPKSAKGCFANGTITRTDWVIVNVRTTEALMYGTLTLHRFNGTETYPILSAQILLYPTEDGECLNLEIECDRVLTQTTDDTADYPAAPNAEVSVYRSHFDASTLVGQRFVVDSSYDESLGDYISRFYYYEQECIDYNVVEFLSQDSDSRYHVRWTGKTMDPNYYDGSKPDTVIEIEARFMLKR